jgi:hypothetical protein
VVKYKIKWHIPWYFFIDNLIMTNLNRKQFQAFPYHLVEPSPCMLANKNKYTIYPSSLTRATLTFGVNITLKLAVYELRLQREEEVLVQ